MSGVGRLTKIDQARIWTRDGLPLDKALARTTHLGIGAHQDDLEFMAFEGIALCHGKSHLGFAGVTCTDGRGSARKAGLKETTPDSLASMRSREQEEAARIGKYTAMIQLGHSSAETIDPAFTRLERELASILEACPGSSLYTHNPADKHRSHTAVFAAVLRAIRSLPPESRPARLVGCEVWRDLDWLCDHEKVRMDVSGHDTLANRLNAVFVSQIAGGKRYDLAVTGRRAANATFYEPRDGDAATQVITGMDLTPLMGDDRIDPVEFTCAMIQRFEAQVRLELRHYFPD